MCALAPPLLGPPGTLTSAVAIVSTRSWRSRAVRHDSTVMQNDRDPPATGPTSSRPALDHVAGLTSGPPLDRDLRVKRLNAVIADVDDGDQIK